MKTLSPLSSQHEQIVKNLISDSVIFYRHCSKVIKSISRITGRMEQTLEVEDNYIGCINAIELMGIYETDENSNLIESLLKIFYSAVDVDIDSNLDSNLVAQEVFQNWKAEIEETNLFIKSLPVPLN